MKAILVIDMPEIDENTKNGCRNCRYARKRMTLSEEYLCSITEQSAYVYDMKCPLKPMPERKCEERAINRRVRDFRFEGGFRVDTVGMAIDEYAKGFNACIDEMLGEEE